jgi:hypothetical protein
LKIFYSGQALKKITPIPGLRLIINKKIGIGLEANWILKIGIFKVYMITYKSYFKKYI